MSFLLTRRPEKLFIGTTKFSRWTALNNPYLFEFTRADYPVFNTLIRTAYSSTLPTVWVDADASVLALNTFVGDTIYINSGNYNGTYTVQAINGQFITLDTPYIGNGGAGRMNLVERLTNYKAFINVYDAVTDELLDTVFPKPDSTGLLIYDVSGVLRSIVETQFNSQQTDINIPNKGTSGSFKLGYGATYKVVIPSITTNVTIPEYLDPTVYYWSSASKQIDGDTTLGMNGIGQNLKEYVPKNIATSEAKFLTMFETPTYFKGHPFFLSFIYDNDFDATYLERHQQDLNVNGVNVGAETDDTIFVTGLGYVNNMLVRLPNTGSNSFDVWLDAGAEIPSGGGYVESGGIGRQAASEFAEPLNP